MYFHVSIYIFIFIVYFVYFSCINVKAYFVLSAGPARGSGGPEANYLQNYSIWKKKLLQILFKCK